MIAAVHFNVNSPLSNHSLANGLFVHFFFTLSGFVMYLNYNKIEKLEGWGKLSVENFVSKKKIFFLTFIFNLK